MNWNQLNQLHALADGWGIFDNSDHGIRIERYGDRFDSDVAAQVYVAARAINGDQLARLAWLELAWHHAVIDAAEIERENHD